MSKSKLPSLASWFSVHSWTFTESRRNRGCISPIGMHWHSDPCSLLLFYSARHEPAASQKSYSSVSPGLRQDKSAMWPLPFLTSRYFHCWKDWKDSHFRLRQSGSVVWMLQGLRKFSEIAFFYSEFILPRIIRFSHPRPHSPSPCT